MTRPRKEQVCLNDTPYYHIVSRCVRRTFLCGTDGLTGKNYEHRRQWIEDRIRILSSIFGVDICAYGVMSNHIHLVVKLSPDSINTLDHKEILERWTSLFKGPLLVQKWRSGETLDTAQWDAVTACIDVYRKRLNDLGWFMKCLNEPIARQANKEDGCTGHFWESRYKSQALLTEEAVLSAMAYVDLNPVRAGMAKTPESSQHTSIKERIHPQFDLRKALHEQQKLDALNDFNIALKPLLAFEGCARHHQQNGILFAFEDYLQLVDVSGRCIRADKKHAIPQHLPPILQGIEIDYETWLQNVTQFESIYHQRFGKKARQRSRAA
ncbi:REP element-mobilizing transposase RayT [Alteromonadaceae bacterium 2753L.S.0a.02]|nr:REP element-mobilizing transposase RayT [Alteromonadaceae bacterium 2753L.S.0a.02]